MPSQPDPSTDDPTTSPGDEAPVDETGHEAVDEVVDETGDQGTDGEGAQDDPRGNHGAGAASSPADVSPTGAQLERRPQGDPAAMPAAAPPPRRTGVFLDAADLRAHVGDLLRAMLGGYEVDAAGNFTFTHESARIFVTIGASPVGPTVGVLSITNVDVDFTVELGGFLLTTNHTLGFGAFSYDPKNRAVWLKHTLLGTMIDVPELQAALMAVASTAAKVDKPIRDEFGGRCFMEAPAEVQQQAHPPETDGGPVNATGYL